MQDDPRAERRHHGHIACELNDVAKPFVLMDQDGLARDGRIAEPHRLGEIATPDRQAWHLPTRLAPGPPGIEISSEKMEQARVPVRLGIRWIGLLERCI